MVESKSIVNYEIIEKRSKKQVIQGIKELFENYPGVVFSLRELRKRFGISILSIIEIMGILNREYDMNLRWVNS